VRLCPFPCPGCPERPGSKNYPFQRRLSLKDTGLTLHMHVVLELSRHSPIPLGVRECRDKQRPVHTGDGGSPSAPGREYRNLRKSVLINKVSDSTCFRIVATIPSFACGHLSRTTSARATSDASHRCHCDGHEGKRSCQCLLKRSSKEK
jgi:hypothetical protein